MPSKPIIGRDLTKELHGPWRRRCGGVGERHEFAKLALTRLSWLGLRGFSAVSRDR